MKFNHKRITALRAEKGLSKREFAKILSVYSGKAVARQSVIQWEKGDCKPSVETLGRICDVFDIEISFFFN